MLDKSDLYHYQQEAVDHVLSQYGSMLWLDIGLGKTIVSLTAVEHLLDAYRIKAALVVAPIKVIEAVWEQEARKWEHTKRLTFSLVRGTPYQRLMALCNSADIYLINYEQLKWLQETLDQYWTKRDKPFPFDMVVFDEVSKMKTATTSRGKAFTKILDRFNYRVGLTGTPATNGVQDLHGQYLMVDGGYRLGPNITGFRRRWLVQNPYNQKWQPRRGATEEIQRLISDITLEMKATDYLELPPLVDKDWRITLPPKPAKLYKEFEKEFFVTLDDGAEVEAFNAAAKSTKCRQLANGAVYDTEDRSSWSAFHSEKLDILEEVVEELQGKPLLICYQFRHDIARVLDKYPDAVLLDRKNVADTVEAWNRGEIKMLIGNAASMGHGLNLQKGGNNILWYGLPWSLELYDQAIGRLLRNGQQGEVVINHRIYAEGTVEEAVLDALKGKSKTQNDLRAAVKKYRLAKTSC